MLSHRELKRETSGTNGEMSGRKRPRPAASEDVESSVEAAEEDDEDYVCVLSRVFTQTNIKVVCVYSDGVVTCVFVTGGERKQTAGARSCERSQETQRRRSSAQIQ